MKIVKLIMASFDRIMNALAFVAGILANLLMLGISAEVITRYVFRTPLLGMVEASEIIMLYIAFLGAAWLLRSDGHVCMDVIINRLKPRPKGLLNSVTSVIGAAIAFVLFWYGTGVTYNLFLKGTMESGNLEIQKGYVMLIIPLGSLLLFIQFLRRAYLFWKEAKPSINSV
jgi:C4-dicarboxylate transporter DctQ subunit